MSRVNNAATQNEVENIENLESEQWRHVSLFFPSSLSVADE
jgi:hypothetical protein